MLKVWAKKSLEGFIQLTMPDYQFNWHHLYMIDKLERFAAGEIKRLMVFMPPRHGKSQLVSRHLPAYIFSRNPNARVIACSYSADLASAMNRDVQRLMDSEAYRETFPESQLNSKNVVTTQSWLRNNTVFEIVNSKGFYICAGVGGPITGKGGDFAIIDDPVKNAEEAASPTIRNKHWEWFTSTFYTRLEKDGAILLTMTRWNEDDLAGRLLRLAQDSEEADKWEIINFPAICENDENPEDPRQPGEALWRDKYDEAKLATIKSSVGSRVWASLYQQRPAPAEGGLIKKDWFSTYQENELTGKEIVNFYLDTAYTEKQENDPTAILAYIQKGNKIYIKRSATARKSFPDLIAWIRSFAHENGYTSRSRIVIEPKASGLSVVQQLKRESGLNVIADKPPKDSKVTRVNSVSAIIEAGRVLIPERANWTDQFLHECAVFPNGSHDDQVDCLVGAINQAFRNSSIAQMV